jgi:hypothetical protein
MKKLKLLLILLTGQVDSIAQTCSAKFLKNINLSFIKIDVPNCQKK